MTSLDSYLQAQSNYANAATHYAAIALQWTASNATEDGNGYPISESGDEYTDAVGEIIRANVTAFVEANYALLASANVTAEMCGHDLILTANHHGTGFWDRGLDMPANDTEALTAYQAGRAFYTAWLAEHRPYPGDHPRSVGAVLAAATRGYSFDAEFALWGDRADGDAHCADEVAWLMVENTVLLDDLGWS
jgi:hypothetical protein